MTLPLGSLLRIQRPSNTVAIKAGIAMSGLMVMAQSHVSCSALTFARIAHSNGAIYAV